MEEKITYSVIEIHAKRIRELVENAKYRSPEDFIKNAIEILLTWESSRPEECMELMKSLMPFSPEQEKFMEGTMQPAAMERHFGSVDVDGERDRQDELARTDDDHLKLRKNFGRISRHARGLDVAGPAKPIPYDGHPLLSGGYSRLLPVKISLAVLGQLLEREKSGRVDIRDLRIHAYDIAEEIGSELARYEKENEIPRNKKKSTGLPRRPKDDGGERNEMAAKRFKDLFVGRIRDRRAEGKKFFDGALSALGLAYASEEDGRTFISLTSLGREVLVMENPVILGDYENGSLSGAESDFIWKRLIPKLKLERQFADAAIRTIKQSGGGGGDDKITLALDRAIRDEAMAYMKKNPAAGQRFSLGLPEMDEEAARRKVSQWRLATMGRLAELGIVRWKITEDSSSEYTLNDSPHGPRGRKLVHA